MLIPREYRLEDGREPDDPALREAQALLWARAAGEAVDGIDSRLRQMLELARRSAADGCPDRESLQKELDRLRREIDSIADALRDIPAPREDGTSNRSYS